VAFARSVAKRWELPSDQLRFVHCSALDALRAVERNYDGQVEWILVNFPTPFATSNNGRRSGNSHLPRSVRSREFMANEGLFAAARHCLAARGGGGLGHGALLLQTQVEDVAVALRGMAEASGWVAVTDGSLGPQVASAAASSADAWLPRRQLEHVSAGGLRASGPGWLAASPLPERAATETERHYEGEGLRVHRVVLRPT